MAALKHVPYRGYDIRQESDTSFAIYCSNSFVARCNSLPSAVSFIDGSLRPNLKEAA